MCDLDFAKTKTILGTFWQCNGKSIGSGSEGVDSSLQEQYNKDLTLKEAETIALSILKQVMEEKVTPNNVDIAKVAPTYHLYAPAECSSGCGGMERGFLSQKGSGVGRGVKEKNLNRNKMNTVTGTSLTAESDGILNDDTPVVDASAAKEFVSPFMVDMNVEKDKRSPLVENTNTVITGVGSYPPLPTSGTTPARNTLGKSSYVNVIGESSKKAVNIYTLFTPRGMRLILLCKWSRFELLAKEDVGNVPVWVKLHDVPITAFSDDGLSAITTKLGTPLMLDSYTSDMCLQSWGRSSYDRAMGRSSYDRAMIELRVDVELKDTIVEECPMNTGLGVAKNVKKPSQTSRVVSVGPKMGFKPHKEYRHVLKKPTASSSSNKKKDVEPTNEVSNSNPFEVRNSVDNDVELGTNGGTTNLVNNEANSSGSSFMNVDNGSTSTTPVSDKIEKFEDSLIDGQAILVDGAGNPLKNVKYPGDYDSEDEVASVDNDMICSMASEMVGFDTQCLLEQ
nr:proteasome subunit alpha type-5 [Tanacetum cinerariifolium]